MNEETPQKIYLGCIFCGVEKNGAISDSCYKDRMKKLLIPPYQSGMDEMQKHFWTEIKVAPPGMCKSLTEFLK